MMRKWRAMEQIDMVNTIISESKNTGYYEAKHEQIIYIKNRLETIQLLHDACQNQNDTEGALEAYYKHTELEKVFLELTKEFAGEEETVNE